MGTFFVSLLGVIFDGLPPQKIPSASGLSNFLRITAGSFATSLITTFWDRREALHQTHLAETGHGAAPSYQQSLAQLHQFGLGDQAAAGSMTQRPSDKAMCCPRSIFSIFPRGRAWHSSRYASSSGGPQFTARSLPRTD